MGMFKDRQVAYDVDVRIEVVGSATLFGGRFQLLIAGEKADEATCRVGKSVTLRGKLRRDEQERPVEVQITQTFVSTRFRLLVDGKELPLKRHY
jgi:hypothetical protein